MSLAAYVVKRIAAGAAVAAGVGLAAGPFGEAGLAVPVATPETAVLALTWEAAHCRDCERPESASEASARARQRR